MNRMSLPACLRSSTPWRAITHDEGGNEGIELTALVPSNPAARAGSSHLSRNEAASTMLLARVCKQLQAGLAARVRDLGHWFARAARKLEKWLVSAAVSAKAAAASSPLAPALSTVPGPPGARAANGRKRSAGEARSCHAQTGKAGRQHDLPGSVYRMASLKEVLRKAPESLPPAAVFVQRINRLYYRNELASQVGELHLAELKSLWSHIFRKGQQPLAPGAMRMLCARGNALLCTGFRKEAIVHQAGKHPGARSLPGWAADAPAEWDPKDALRRAYRRQIRQPAVRSAAARPLSAASSQSHPQKAAPAALRDRAASAPASGIQLSR